MAGSLGPQQAPQFAAGHHPDLTELLVLAILVLLASHLLLEFILFVMEQTPKNHSPDPAAHPAR